MKRLTSGNTFEMNMRQLALNQVYVGKDGWARYVEGPECECSVCDLIRTASETLGVELPILSDEDLSDLMTDWLQYGAEEPEGVVAILDRALCAMAEVRDKLFRYEDTGLEPEEIMALIAPPNAPLTLEELREMDGEPVWVVELNGYPPHWGLVYWCRKSKRNIVYVTTNNGASICAEAFLTAGGKIYRRRPEVETA